MSDPAPIHGQWLDGKLPPNVMLGDGTIVIGPHCFKRFFGKASPAIVIGRNCTLDAISFAIGPEGVLRIGDACYMTGAVFLCEQEVRIGNHVALGWNVTIGDTDFHPLDPDLRRQDALACSPLNKDAPRPPIARSPVIIDDDVWIGPAATILKGVHIGAGAVIEAGSLVTRDVPAGTRVAGNPARPVAEV